jgi:hypothetical protein
LKVLFDLWVIANFLILFLFQVLFVPFTATGVFYPIAPRGGRNPQHIYPLAAIARLQRLPARVKMVFGALPPNLPDFSGEFVLKPRLPTLSEGWFLSVYLQVPLN